MKKKICLLIFIQARDRKWNAKTTINIKLVFFFILLVTYTIQLCGFLQVESTIHFDVIYRRREKKK